MDLQEGYRLPRAYFEFVAYQSLHQCLLMIERCLKTAQSLGALATSFLAQVSPLVSCSSIDYTVQLLAVIWTIWSIGVENIVVYERSSLEL